MKHLIISTMEPLLLHVVIVASYFSLAIAILLSQVSVIEGRGVQNVNCNVTCMFSNNYAPEVDCLTRRLSEIPTGCSPWMETIDLRGNGITIIGSRTFERYKHLKTLHLEHNPIANIARGAFKGCDSLLKVYLQRNALQSVEEETFEGANHLERLFLTENNISTLHRNAFLGLDLLLTLDIANNHLQTLPPGIFDSLVSLTTINLENNKLLRVEGSLFAPLVSLQTLNLSNNRIMMTTEFPTLPNLRILDLYHNVLQNIDDISSEISEVDELYLGDNPINCTCSVNAVREWIVMHRGDYKVNINRVSVVCQEPPGLKRRYLVDIPKTSLCPELQSESLPAPPEATTKRFSLTYHILTRTFLTKVEIQSVPTTESTSTSTISTMDTTTTTKTSPENLRQRIQNNDQSKLDLRAAYGICGTVLSILIIIVIVLMIFLKSRRSFHERRQGEQRNQNTPMAPHMTNGDIVHRDNGTEYETFSNDSSTRLHNQDLNPDYPPQDAPSYPTHHNLQDHSDPVYISLDDALSTPQQTPPEPQQPNTNPFLQATPRGTYQAVLFTEGAAENPPVSGYVPHSFVPPTRPSGSSMLNTAPHVTPNCKQDFNTGGNPESLYTPACTSNHLAPSQSTNPFHAPTNPFAHMTQV